ncbi:hypothetical protein [Deinococcus marmoris]|uniref:Uncharacterized protein n=1 Tax=Deinococcus marmoris TaxID=249408 RepID=A0A1U7P1W8_9DEIO|nr:hypothetical protein [Deinococcus marmoris]OLV19163.1 hypothetical protein BOO71_0003565 [Deinococcus marmoris]
MNTPINTAITGYGTLTAGFNRDGWRQPLTPVTVVIPPWAIALERWVDEGGFGNDPDDTARPNQTRIPPPRKDQ